MSLKEFFQRLLGKPVQTLSAQANKQRLQSQIVVKPISNARLLHIKRREQEQLVKNELKELKATILEKHDFISTKYGLAADEIDELNENARLGLKYSKRFGLWTGGNAKARGKKAKDILQAFTPENRRDLLNLLGDKKELQQRVEEYGEKLKQARAARIRAFNRVRAERNRSHYLGE